MSIPQRRGIPLFRGDECKAGSNRPERLEMPCTNGLGRKLQSETKPDVANTRINQVFHWEGLESRQQRPTHFTPPYVTARPVVTHRKITVPREKLKFIILATDGREFGVWHR